jgi:hypothetical protein
MKKQTPKQLMAKAIFDAGYDPKNFYCSYMPHFSERFSGAPVDYDNPKTCTFDDLPDNLDSFECSSSKGTPHFSFDLDRTPHIKCQDI